MTYNKLVIATVCGLGLTSPAFAQGIQLDDLLDTLGLSNGTGDIGSGDELLTLDGLAMITLGNNTIISSPTERPLVTANILDPMAADEQSILHLAIGQDNDSGTTDRPIKLSELDSLLDNLTGGGNDDSGLGLDGLIDLRLGGETLIASGGTAPLVSANLLDRPTENGQTIANLTIGNDRQDNDQIGVDSLGELLDDVAAIVSNDSRDRSRGLLRLDGLAEVTLGDATLISSASRSPAISANVLERSGSDNRSVARVNVETNQDSGGLLGRDSGGSDNDNRRDGLVERVLGGSDNNNGGGLGGTVGRLTGGLLR